MTTTDHDVIDVQHDEDGHRYVMRSSGETVGLIEYEREGDVFDLRHTEVLPQGQGNGLGKVLVRDALDDIREHGHRIVATCPYVQKFVAEHPEYQDLQAG
jgi:uncharacterized protein